MPRISSKHFENFGDGLLTICEADENKTGAYTFWKQDGRRDQILAGANGRKPGG